MATGNDFLRRGIVPSKNQDQGRARPVFRFLALAPALGAWLLLAALLSQLDPDRATLQGYWEIVLTLFIAVLFSVAAIFGRVPRWLYRLVPYSSAWEDQTSDLASGRRSGGMRSEDLPPELPTSVGRLRLFAFFAMALSISFIYGAFHSWESVDWLGGVRGPLALLVLPVASLFPRLAPALGAAIQGALGVVALFASIACFAIGQEGARSLERSRSEGENGDRHRFP